MSLLNKFRSLFLDLFFPKKCLGCGAPDTYLCRDCFNKITLVERNCFKIKDENCLERVIYAGPYADPLLRELIHALKYRFVKELAEPLSRLMIKTIESFSLHVQINSEYFLIVPVPLHKIRERSRGFNQAQLLSERVAEYFKIPLRNDVLKRTKYTAPQAKITNTEKRKENIKNIFFAAPDEIKGKIVILVDDVITTGATLVEAAKSLKRSGAKEIWALVIAKG
jgi:competence protein ComFC